MRSLRRPRLFPSNPEDQTDEPLEGQPNERPEEQPDEQRAQALKKALDLLSRRDHAAGEIQQKLVTRGFGGTVIDGVLEYLFDRNYLNDLRFAESFVRMRSGKGYGERDIRARLSARGISKTDITKALAICDADWNQLALDALKKKFRHIEAASFDADHLDAAQSDVTAHDSKLRERGARFLQTRGFSADQTFSALDELIAVRVDHGTI